MKSFTLLLGATMLALSACANPDDANYCQIPYPIYDDCVNAPVAPVE